MKINSKFFHIGLIIYCAAIFILSSIPGDNLPKVDFEFSDKFIHMGIYAILFILFFYSLKNQTRNVRLQRFALEYSLLFTSFYGLSDELHQYFVPYRSCELYDWIADCLGALIMYFGFKLFYSRKNNLVVAFFLLFLFGCTGAKNINQSYTDNIYITETEAWLDLMPVIGERQNNFGFLISLNIETESKDTNYSIKDLKIFLNNDTLHNKKFESDFMKISEKVYKLNIFQERNEIYFKTEKEPSEAKFLFKVYRSNKKLKNLSTPMVKVNKVY